jgi:hypothetical protein
MQDDKMLKSRKIRYGGKINETFVIKEVAKGKDSIHFLGLRGPVEVRSAPGFAWNKPVILHYVDYNIKKRKATRKHSIFKNTPNAISSYYGPLSIDNFEDDVFVVFSWVQSISKTRPIPIKDFKSDIYYYQYSDNASGDVERIGDGFMPLVKVDSFGNVHVLWVNNDGGLVHKVKKNGSWSKEKVIINNLDIYTCITIVRYISAEFDSDNNLHVVYPSGGNLVHAVVNVN